MRRINVASKKTRRIAPRLSYNFNRQFRKKIMPSTKNETSYEFTAPIIHQIKHVDKKFFRSHVTVDELIALRMARYVIIDFEMNRGLTAELPNGSLFHWDIVAFSLQDKECLLADLLQDKTVIGHNLTSVYALFLAMWDEWRPACTLDTRIIARTYGLALASGRTPLEKLYKLTKATSFDTALETLVERDSQWGGMLFNVLEPLQFAIAHEFANGLRKAMSDSRALKVKFRLHVDEDIDVVSLVTHEMHTIFTFGTAQLDDARAIIDEASSGVLELLKDLAK